MSPALTAPDHPLGKTVWRFVWVNTLLSLFVWAFEMISDVSLPTGTSLVIHLLAIAAAMHQFVTHFVTTMNVRDRLKFAAMVSVIGLATIAIEILLAISAEGIELTLPGIAEGLGLEVLTPGLLFAAAAVAFVIAFVVSLAAVSFFVWLFRRSQEQGI